MSIFNTILMIVYYSWIWIAITSMVCYFAYGVWTGDKDAGKVVIVVGIFIGLGTYLNSIGKI